MLVAALLAERSFLGLRTTEWTAIASSAAVIFALWATFSERRRSDRAIENARRHSDAHIADERALTRAALKLDRTRWEADLDERRGWQSRRVTCWRHAASGTHTTVRIANDSEAAVFAARAWVRYQGVVRWSDMVRGPIVMAGTTEDIRVNVGSEQGTVVPNTDFGVLFRDASGVNWVRTNRGDLFEAGGSPPITFVESDLPSLLADSTDFDAS